MLQTMPKVFEDYMQNEQNNLQAEIYQNKLKQVDITRTALLQAGQDLINSTTQDITPPTTLTKEYVELSAKIATLQDELNHQSKKAAESTGRGLFASYPTVTTHSTTVGKFTSTQCQSGCTRRSDKSPGRCSGIQTTYCRRLYLYRTLRVIQLPLTTLTDETINQAYTQASNQIYTNTINAMENISTELSKAKVEMDKLAS